VSGYWLPLPIFDIIYGMSDQVLPTVPQQNVPPVATPSLSGDRVVSPAPSAIAQPVVNAVANSIPAMPTPQGPSFKESKPFLSSEAGSVIETASGESAIEKEPIPEEVEAWMEKVNQEQAAEKLPQIELPPAPVTPTTPQVASSLYVLPLGKMELDKGKHASVNDSIHWLAAWCVRVIKKLGPQQIAYKQ
jgi:hypothetical protein